MNKSTISSKLHEKSVKSDDRIWVDGTQQDLDFLAPMCRWLFDSERESIDFIEKIYFELVELLPDIVIWLMNNKI